MTSPRSSVDGGVSSRARLRALGLRPNKGLSQSFLEDQVVAAAIVGAAGLNASQNVLEVGPGLGVLTARLAAQARRVVAIEIDSHLADALRHEFQGGNVSIVTQDVLHMDPSSYFDGPYSVVANLPYHITSPALRHLLHAGPPFAERLVVMVQAEVADRIAAPAGDLSSLAVAIQVQATVRVVLRVPSAAFYPRPKVDSAVLLVEPLADSERLVSRFELEAFSKVVQAGFTQPRKTLLNSLSQGLGSDKSATAETLTRAGIDGSLRPQALGIADWVRLYRGGET
jgi:16S rRNA (adenine1518-N6/adenine1519-N6)-dimethyltransferase